MNQNYDFDISHNPRKMSVGISDTYTHKLTLYLKKVDS